MSIFLNTSLNKANQSQIMFRAKKYSTKSFSTKNMSYLISYLCKKAVWIQVITLYKIIDLLICNTLVIALCTSYLFENMNSLNFYSLFFPCNEFIYVKMLIKCARNTRGAWW